MIVKLAVSSSGYINPLILHPIAKSEPAPRIYQFMEFLFSSVS